MDLDQLKKNVENFAHPDYGRVGRDGAAYLATERFVKRGLKICLFLYQKIERLDQTARLLRDAIDFLLRRYHGYAIKERIKAHYRDASITSKDKTDFEHVIPAALIGALLIQGRISVNMAMNPPTCLVKKADHARLKKLGLSHKTPDIWFFWKRYEALGIKIETHNGESVDSEWNLGTHYKFFNVKD